MRTILGADLSGLYLEGSLALGAFDTASDIDFVAATHTAITDAQFDALSAMHDALATIDSPLALNIEGFYVPRAALRRYDPAHEYFASIERGPGERLKHVTQDQYWIVHRSILRDRGIVVLGPPLADQIDPISSDNLRSAMRTALREWGDYVVQNPQLLRQAGYQSYAVLTICRMLFTQVNGRITGKTEAAAWAAQILEARWQPLIKNALADRLVVRIPSASESDETRAFLDFARRNLHR